MADQLQAISDASLARTKNQSISVLANPAPFILDLLDNSVVLRVRRRDSLAEAISRYVSAVRGYHHSTQKATAKIADRAVDYNFPSLRKHLLNILEGEAFLDEFRKQHLSRNKPKEFTYEQFGFYDKRSHIFQVLELMGLPAQPVKERILEKLSGKDSEDLREQFLIDWRK